MKPYTSPMLRTNSISGTDLITTSVTNINGEVGLGGSGHGTVRTPSRIWD